MKWNSRRAGRIARAAATACLLAATVAHAAPRARQGWRAYPNPFSRRFRIEQPDSLTRVGPPFTASVRVYSMVGRLVREWTIVNEGNGWVVDWDGQTMQGSVAPSGWYIFDIRFHDVPGQNRLRFKMLRIRGTLDHNYDFDWT